MHLTGTSEKMILVVDNGSLSRWSTLNLRCVASGLSTALNLSVYPVSVEFSDRIAVSELGGEAAVVFENFIHSHYAKGIHKFLTIPFMFTAGGGIAGILLEKIAQLVAELPDLDIQVAPFLFDETLADNCGIAEIIANRVEATIETNQLVRPAVIVVDHGSPKVQATYVRNIICGQVSVMLRGKIGAIGAASMERREGDRYAFNQPLLAERLDTPPFNEGSVIIAMLFLSTGRHAGEDGDIAAICAAARLRHAQLAIYMTELVGTHPNVIKCLKQSYTQALS